MIWLWTLAVELYALLQVWGNSDLKKKEFEQAEPLITIILITVSADYVNDLSSYQWVTQWLNPKHLLYFKPLHQHWNFKNVYINMHKSTYQQNLQLLFLFYQDDFWTEPWILISFYSIFQVDVTHIFITLSLSLV